MEKKTLDNMLKESDESSYTDLLNMLDHLVRLISLADLVEAYMKFYDILTVSEDDYKKIKGKIERYFDEAVEMLDNEVDGYKLYELDVVKTLTEICNKGRYEGGCEKYSMLQNKITKEIENLKYKFRTEHTYLSIPFIDYLFSKAIEYNKNIKHLKNLYNEYLREMIEKDVLDNELLLVYQYYMSYIARKKLSVITNKVEELGLKIMLSERNIRKSSDHYIM